MRLLSRVEVGVLTNVLGARCEKTRAAVRTKRSRCEAAAPEAAGNALGPAPLRLATTTGVPANDAAPEAMVVVAGVMVAPGSTTVLGAVVGALQDVVERLHALMPDLESDALANARTVLLGATATIAGITGSPPPL